MGRIDTAAAAEHVAATSTTTMQQLSLDDAAKALARRTDPVTSKLGAIDAAKRIGALQRRALDAVRMHPDRTATELARMDGLGDPRTYNRRLGELRDAGLIVTSGMRACSITGRQAMTWRVVG